MHSLQLRNTLPPRQHHQRRDTEQRESYEPPRPIEGGQYDDAQALALGVPEPVPVVGNDLERVATWRELGIVGGPAGTRVDPVTIETGELVLELDLLGAAEIQAGILDLQVLLPRFYPGDVVERPCRAVDRDLLDDHRRWHTRHRLGIEHGDALDRREPQLAVRSAPPGRLSAAIAFARFHPVGD